MNTARAIEIKVALMRIGKTQTAIAKDLNVAVASVNDVIKGKIKSRRIMAYIENTIKQNAAKCTQ